MPPRSLKTAAAEADRTMSIKTQISTSHCWALFVLIDSRLSKLGLSGLGDL